MNVTNENGAFGAEFFKAGREIAQEPLGFGGILDRIGANVNDRSVSFQPIGLHETGFAHGRNDDVGAANDFREFARFGMADGDGGVGVHEQKCHGLADNIAAAENNCICTFDGNAAAAQNLHAARRRAGDEAGTSADEAAQADRVKAVHIFRGIDGFEDALGVHLRRKRKLDQDAVHAVVAIQILHHGEQFQGADRCRGREQRAREAKLFAGGNFALDVELRSGTFADEDGG